MTNNDLPEGLSAKTSRKSSVSISSFARCQADSTSVLSSRRAPAGSPSLLWRAKSRWSIAFVSCENQGSVTWDIQVNWAIKLTFYLFKETNSLLSDGAQTGIATNAGSVNGMRFVDDKTTRRRPTTEFCSGCLSSIGDHFGDSGQIIGHVGWRWHDRFASKWSRPLPL